MNEGIVNAREWWETWSHEHCADGKWLGTQDDLWPNEDDTKTANSNVRRWLMKMKDWGETRRDDDQPMTNTWPVTNGEGLSCCVHLVHLPDDWLFRLEMRLIRVQRTRWAGQVDGSPGWFETTNTQSNKTTAATSTHTHTMRIDCRTISRWCHASFHFPCSQFIPYGMHN